METLTWILLSGLAMSGISFVGALSFFLSETQLKKLIPILVAMSAGTLIGGALFHMVPGALDSMNNHLLVFIWLVVGFSLFFVLEQYMHWHHCHKAPSEHKKPLTYFLLLADGIHNFVGGIGVGGAFVVDIRLGIASWLAAALHEIPQELGDFGVLVHGGWEKKQALLYNFFSALSFPIGGVVAFLVAQKIDVAFLVPFAAGNFLYIAAADLIPEIKHQQSLRTALSYFAAFVFGLILLLTIPFFFPSHPPH